MRHRELLFPSALLAMLFFWSNTFTFIQYNGVRELFVAIILGGGFFLAKQLACKRLPAVHWIFYAQLTCICIGLHFLPLLFLYLPFLLFPRFTRPLYGWLSTAFVFFTGLYMPLGYQVPFIVSLLTFLSGSFYSLQKSNQAFVQRSYAQIDTLRLQKRKSTEALHRLSAMQDSKIHTTRLEERRRMTGEIHDLLGHQLSSALIQIAALQYLTEDETVKRALTEVHGVLHRSMDHVRAVIHHEQAEAVELEAELSMLCRTFTKCRIQFTYTNHQEPSPTVSHQIIYVVREALANINKHSNATAVDVRFMEFEGMWTLLVKDNGTPRGETSSYQSGIGLLNMEKRMDSIGAQLIIHRENGFRIFCRIPKTSMQEVS